MKITIASGKGGTGKTTIATSLALSLAERADVWFYDCDVEAPNAHLFLKPEINTKSQAVTLIPKIDQDLCTLCGKCVEVCQFHALAKVGKTILVFPQLCHGCGSCTWNCPEKAIQEIPNPIGALESGITAEGIHFQQGILTISEPMATPIIRQLKKTGAPLENSIVICDAPPGASCSAVESLRGADFTLLVTEPTPFGLHDLRQILEIAREMEIPFGVIINRDGLGNSQMDQFLMEQQLDVLMRVPFDRELAKGLAAGTPLVEVRSEYREKLLAVYEKICQAHKGSTK